MVTSDSLKEMASMDKILLQTICARYYQNKGVNIISASLGHPTYAANLSDCFEGAKYWEAVYKRAQESSAKLLDKDNLLRIAHSEDFNLVKISEKLLKQHLSEIYTESSYEARKMMAQGINGFYGLTLTNRFIIKAHNIIFSFGGTGALHNIFNFLNKRRKGCVINPRPSYTLYVGPQNSNVLISTDVTEDSTKTPGYRFTGNVLKNDILTARKLGHKINAILLCNPNNPMGTVINKNEWEEIIEECYDLLEQEEDCYFIFDEAYAQINFTGQPFFLQYIASRIIEIEAQVKKDSENTGFNVTSNGLMNSAASVPAVSVNNTSVLNKVRNKTKEFYYKVLERSLIIQSATKGCSLSGERQGVIIAFDPKIIEGLRKEINDTGEPSVALQFAYAATMMSFADNAVHDPVCDAMQVELEFLKPYHKMLVQYTAKELERLKLSLPDPNYKVEGTFYILANLDFLSGYKVKDSYVLDELKKISKLKKVDIVLENNQLMKDVEIVYFLMVKYGISITPLSYFLANPFKCFVRLTCSVGREKLDIILKVFRTLKEEVQLKSNEITLETSKLDVKTTAELHHNASSASNILQQKKLSEAIMACGEKVPASKYKALSITISKSPNSSPKVNLKSLFSLPTPMTALRNLLKLSSLMTEQLSVSRFSLLLTDVHSLKHTPMTAFRKLTLTPRTAYYHLTRRFTMSYNLVPQFSDRFNSARYTLAGRKSLINAREKSKNNADVTPRSQLLTKQSPMPVHRLSLLGRKRSNKMSAALLPQMALNNAIEITPQHELILEQIYYFTQIVNLSTEFAQHMYNYWHKAYVKSLGILKIREENFRQVLVLWNKFKNDIKKIGKEWFLSEVSDTEVKINNEHQAIEDECEEWFLPQTTMSHEHEENQALKLKTDEVRKCISEYIKKANFTCKDEFVSTAERRKKHFDAIFESICLDVISGKENACTSFFWNTFGEEINELNFSLIEKICEKNASIDYGHPEGDEENRKLTARTFRLLYRDKGIEDNALLFFGGKLNSFLNAVFNNQILTLETFLVHSSTNRLLEKNIAIIIKNKDFLCLDYNKLLSAIEAHKPYIILMDNAIDLLGMKGENNILHLLFNCAKLPKNKFILVQTAEGLFSTEKERVSVFAVFDSVLKTQFSAYSMNFHVHPPRSLQNAFSKVLNSFVEQSCATELVVSPLTKTPVFLPAYIATTQAKSAQAANAQIATAQAPVAHLKL